MELVPVAGVCRARGVMRYLVSGQPGWDTEWRKRHTGAAGRGLSVPSPNVNSLLDSGQLPSVLWALASRAGS